MSTARGGRAAWMHLACALMAGCLPMSSNAAEIASTEVPVESVIPGPHAAYARLLERYVTEDGYVRYDDWIARDSDVRALSAYVDTLEAMCTGSLAPEARLGYWIDLYNAATLELVLANLPVESIRDIGGPEGSPWKRHLVAACGDSLTLDEIENDVIRRQLGDARVHFALCCASLGCPPLARSPYSLGVLEERLERSTGAAVDDPRWVQPKGDTLVLSRIFEWYESDFVRQSGSVRAFIDAHRSEKLPAADLRHSYRPYDWSLNGAR